MSNLTKRRLEHIEISNPNKKRKLNDATVSIETLTELNSKLFVDEVDQNQFKMIYNSLTNCDDINYIPSSIIYEISEYATGIIEQCNNYKQCKNQIVLLNHDKLQPNTQRDFYYLNPNGEDQANFDDIFKDCNENIQLFCNECTKKLKQCRFIDKISCEQRYFCSARYIDDNPSKCDCGEIIKMCQRHRYKCKDCKITMCQPPYVHIKYQCSSHHIEHCHECNNQQNNDQYPIYTKSVCIQKGKRCEVCDDYICNDHIINNEWCDCDDSHDKWTHNECDGSSMNKSELDLCIQCGDIMCFRCYYNEPMEYQCPTCTDDYKYQLFCVDCWNVDEKMICDQCGQQLTSNDSTK